MKCFECDSLDNIVHHHVIPRSLGGKKTIPLCQLCHDKVHRCKRYRNISLSNLTKQGLKRAKERGVVLGTSNPKKQIEMMNIACKKTKKDFKAKMLPFVIDMKNNNCKTLRSMAQYLNDKNLVTRSGQRWTIGSVYNLLRD